ncbi:uncharacterized protein [Temnothorax longispinosus]|uniref:BED-type domain-containing protein n=1 Tax=Temnothorax longispinosus TaxID=300112 RepID=A0A4S2KD94_9HYME|nr:hypothetical protein DBV15_04445 [Temnothorax longispinosus]
MAKQKTEYDFVLEHYIPTLMCQYCDAIFVYKSKRFSTFEKIMIQLKEHLSRKHHLEYNFVHSMESVHNMEHDVNKEKIPVRRFVRKHFSKLTNYAAKCRNCFAVVDFTRPRALHNHLHNVHENELTETEHKDKRLDWRWDYLITNKNDDIMGKCKLCGHPFKQEDGIYNTFVSHLNKSHGRTSPSSIDDTSSDSDIDTTVKEVKHQEDSASSSKNSLQMTEGTNDFNEKTNSSSSNDIDDSGSKIDSAASSKNSPQMTKGTNVLNEKTNSSSSSDTDDSGSDMTIVILKVEYMEGSEVSSTNLP